MDSQNRVGRTGASRQRSASNNQMSHEEMLDADTHEECQAQNEEVDVEQETRDKQAIRDAFLAQPAKSVQGKGNQPDDAEPYMTPLHHTGSAFESSMAKTPLNLAVSSAWRRRGASIASSSRDALDSSADLPFSALSTPTSKPKIICTYGGNRTMVPETLSKKQISAKPKPAQSEQAESTETSPRDPADKKYNVARILAKGLHRARYSQKSIEWCYLVQWEVPNEENTWEPVEWMKQEFAVIVAGFEESMNREYLEGPMNFEEAQTMEQQRERKPKVTPAPRERGRPRKKAKVSEGDKVEE
ncbi:hypothetical protein DL98DRAFT_581045 [Cadophora sp. DSE1049]|nr:hypothetical protein DL98DRAFT_581045 [Cadophora sp. DSE1049]